MPMTEPGTKLPGLQREEKLATLRFWYKRVVTGIGAKKDKIVLINYSMLEPVGSFISITAANVIVCNAAGEAARTAVDGN